VGTIRLRLTLWYAALLLAAGVLLLVLVYVLVDRAFPAVDPTFLDRVSDRPQASEARDTLESLGVLPPRRTGPVRPPQGIEGRGEAIIAFVEQGRVQAREDVLDTLVVQSSLGLIAMALISVGAGWWVAGQMLRPVADITDTVRRISGDGLSSHRVSLEGPRDELKELADQFDAMLDRLDAAFRAQREFVANASHELRTPLAVMRAELDVTFDGPDATPEEMRESATVIRHAIGRSEALIAALLTLERADAPRQRAEPVDLAERARTVVEQAAERARSAGIDLRTELASAGLLGDPVLIERMIENLVANAIGHNQAPEGEAGWVEVSVRRDGGDGGDGVLRVANSAADVDALTVDTLFERFRRLDTSRSRETGGHGLGLAIVRAVARHHGGDASAHPVPGGLAFEIRLPLAVDSTEI